MRRNTLTILYIELPLYDSQDYTYQVNLEGKSYGLRFIYNQVMQQTLLTIYNSEVDVLVAGVGLVPNYPITLDYVIPDLTGAFLLLPVFTTEDEFYKTYPTKLKQYYTLSYAYNATV